MRKQSSKIEVPGVASGNEWLESVDVQSDKCNKELNTEVKGNV